MRRSIFRALHKEGLINSFAEARRLIEAKAVTVNDEIVTDGNKLLEPGQYTLHIGKRRVWHEVEKDE